MDRHWRKVESVIREAKQGKWPSLPDDPDWYGRAPDDDEYQRRKQHLLQHGLLCRVKTSIGGSSAYPMVPLLSLQVIPLEVPLMIKPAKHNRVWHISIGFHNVNNRSLEEAFFEKYGTWTTVRLRFEHINDQAFAALDTSSCPIATDPIIQAMHQAPGNYYKNRPLHISF